jgi:hypothetical protein
MALKVGDRRYFLVHAYHHFCGEVLEIERADSILLKNVVRVQSCQRGWAEFFRDGFKDDTEYTVWLDGTRITGAFVDSPWPHDIPKEPRRATRR